MRPRWCHSSFETALARLLRMRSGILLYRPVPWVFELHGDEVGGARAVAGGNAAKRAVERFRRFCIVNRRQKLRRGPVRRDLVGQDTKAVAALLGAGCARERHRL